MNQRSKLVREQRIAAAGPPDHESGGSDRRTNAPNWSVSCVLRLQDRRITCWGER